MPALPSAVWTARTTASEVSFAASMLDSCQNRIESSTQSFSDVARIDPIRIKPSMSESACPDHLVCRLDVGVIGEPDIDDRSAFGLGRIDGHPFRDHVGVGNVDAGAVSAPHDHAPLGDLEHLAHDAFDTDLVADAECRAARRSRR